MKTSHIFLLFLMFFTPWVAKSQPQEVVELSNIQGTEDLSSRLWFLEDKEHILKLPQVLSPEFNTNFAPVDKKIANFGFSSSSWWARAELNNASDRDVELYLLEFYVNVDKIEFFLLDSNGKVLSQKLAGDTIVPADNDVRYRFPYMKMKLPPGRSSLYLHTRTQGTTIFNVAAQTEDAFNNQRLFEYCFAYSMIGVLMIMAAYNFFTYIQLRKTVFLVYVGFIFFLTSQVLSYSGLATHLFHNPSFVLNDCYLYFGNFTNICALLFAMYFLNLKERHPWVYRMCIVVMIAAAVIQLLVSINYNVAAKITVGIAMLTSICTLTAGIASCITRYRPAYFYTLAWIVVIVANLARMSMVAGRIEPSFLAEWGTMMGAAVEVILLSLALADKIRLAEQHAFERIETLNADLRIQHQKVTLLNENLERMVEEQTREIKSILKYIQMGIVMVRDASLSLTETYSQSMKSLYSTDSIEGKNILDLLFDGSNLSSEVRSQTQTILSNALGDDLMNFEVNTHILPHELEYKDGKQTLTYQLDWNPVIDKDERIEKMLVTIRDVTTLKQLESSAREKSRSMALIEEILDITTKQFNVFINSGRRFLDENQNLIKNNKERNHDILKIIMINLHTMKGAARALGLKTLTPVIHEAEHYYTNIMHLADDWDQSKMLAAHSTVDDLLNLYRDINENKLGRGNADLVVMSIEQAERLRLILERLEKEVSSQTKSEIIPFRRHIEDQSYIPGDVVFREVLSNASVLARDLQKEPPIIKVTDKGFKFSSQGQELIRNIFVHIIRNTMDHGLEAADERMAKGKSATGRIEVEMHETDSDLDIIFRDDGRGLNMRAIRDLATRKGFLKPGQSLKAQELAELIFAPDFSTSQVVNDISGRGVGMNAVRQFMENQGGRIELVLDQNPNMDSADYLSFAFHFRFPRGLYIRQETLAQSA